MSEMEELRAKLLAKKKPVKVPEKCDGLSIGFDPLNLACSGHPDWAITKGDMVLWVGSSGSAKTFITLTALAEAAVNPSFKKHRLLFRNPEKGARMNFKHYFGPLAERIKPLGDDRSVVLEEFYDDLGDELRKGPCVCLLDSMDALVPRAFYKKAKQTRNAAKQGEEVKGSYGTEKAKINSDRLRDVPALLAKHGSILIIISQSRDKIGFGSQFDPETRGGGRALKFFASLELWTSVKGFIKKKAPGRDKTLEIGIVCRVKVKKNRIQGKEGRVVNVPILHGHGIDNIGGTADWLVEWKHWKSKGEDEGDGKGNKEVIPSRIVAPELDFSGSRDKLVSLIEAGKRQGELRNLLTRVWNEIEESCAVKREKRYV